jgi:quercetin dioxygenase-like cupin family protein
MKVFNYVSVELEDVHEDSKGLKVRWLLTEKDGAENFAMRLFEMEPGGNTPLHSHSWEHEAFIVEGEGIVVGKKGEKKFNRGDVIFIPKDEEHQFRNPSRKIVKFLCIIPII